MKVTIDLNDLKKFIESLESDCDEWYGPENYNMTVNMLQDFLVWQCEKEFAEDVNKFLQELE